MRAVTLRAFIAVGLTSKGGVSPFPTFAALGYSWVHVGVSYGRNVRSKIEQAVDKCFGLSALL